MTRNRPIIHCIAAATAVFLALPPAAAQSGPSGQPGTQGTAPMAPPPMPQPGAMPPGPGPGYMHFHQAPRESRLNVSASAYREVVQDRVVVRLYAERETPQPAEGQTQVAQMLNPVLAQLKSQTGLEVQSSGFRTDPVWQQSRVVGWRTRGSLQVTGQPSEAFNRLVGELSTKLNVESVSYYLSREAHLAAEQSLIDEAVQAFRSKAETAAKALGYRGFTIREVSVGGSGTPQPMPVPMPRAMAARAEAADAFAPPIPGAEGKTTVVVTVSGAVVLER